MTGVYQSAFVRAREGAPQAIPSATRATTTFFLTCGCRTERRRAWIARKGAALIPRLTRDRRLSMTLRALRAGSVLVVGAALAACASRASFEKPPVVNSVQDAAAIRVTTLSVARWEDYVDALQAQFSMTADVATTLAFPQTSISQSSVADSLALGLQLGLPQSTHTASQGVSGSQGTTTTATTAVNQGATTNTGNAASTSGNSTTNSSSSTLAAGVAPTSTLTTPTAPSTSGIAGPSGALQVDPIDSYNAAASIYEEVQLLNRYLQDGALRYGYVPYVARMQISVMPFARNEPYDVYLDIGLFSQCEGTGLGESLPAVVVPLLVTDDIEKGQATNAVNIARQLALNIAGVVDNVGLGGNVSNLSDSFKSILADTFNSRFMVSRGADNVLEVRIGAATSPVTKVGYSMLAQTHNLSFLLLVKREHAAVAGGYCSPDPKTLHDARVRGTGIERGPVVLLSTLARLRNAKSGEELPTDRTTMLKRARKVVREFPSAGVSDGTLDRLVQDVNGPDPKAFQGDLPPALRSYWTTLWTGLTSVLSMSEYNGTHFNLPYRRVPSAIETQAVIIHDNCKDTATTSLVGFNDAVAGQFYATLELKGGAYLVAANSVVQSTPGAPLTISFPTLNEFGREADDIKGACAGSGPTPNPPRKLEGAKLVVRRLVDDRWISPEEKGLGTGACQEKCLFAFETVVMDGTAQLSQTVGLLAAADSIVADPTTGTGKMRLLITIGKDLDSVKISLSGAVLPTSTQPLVSGSAAISVAGGGFSITPSPAGAGATVAPGPLAVDLTLQGLVVGRAVTITGTGQKDKKATTAAVPVIVVPIVAPPASSKPATTGS